MGVQGPKMGTLLILMGVLGVVSCANILIIFPHHGKSHFMNVKPYFQELARSGHNITVISFFPLKPHEQADLPNYHDVSLRGTLQLTTNNVSITNFESNGLSSLLSPTINNLMVLHGLTTFTRNAIIKSPTLNRFIDQVLTGEHRFDLVITETFQMDLFLGLIYRMQVPFISVTTCNLFAWSADRIGQPQNPSYVPTNIDFFNDQMTLIERVKNTISLFLMKTVHPFVFLRAEQAFAEERFGPGIPPLQEIAKNTSLLLANIHFSLNKPRPVVPQLIEVGGLHIQPPKPLPQDLEKFLNESTHGVIYFCMGSLLRGESFPLEKRKAFLAAFAKLPYDVLWKYEGASLPGQPSNVKILPWTPQRDLLSHPNIKLFITHGGLLGTTEAVYEGVPMLGMPIYGDQFVNVRAIESAGGGVVLDYHSLSEQKILHGIRTVLKPEYKAGIERLQALFRDRPMSPMQTALFWTEYVLRHKGAPHLRTAAVHMPWYQYECLDVLLILAGAVLLIGYALKLALSRLLSKVPLASGFSKSKKE